MSRAGWGPAPSRLRGGRRILELTWHHLSPIMIPSTYCEYCFFRKTRGPWGQAGRVPQAPGRIFPGCGAFRSSVPGLWPRDRHVR